MKKMKQRDNLFSGNLLSFLTWQFKTDMIVLHVLIKVSINKYLVLEIFTSVIGSNFTLKEELI